ncbi:MAG: hypothetical protein WCL00_10165, partial [Bacteroidota bacterium]
MAKSKSEKKLIKVEDERLHFLSKLAINPNYFGNNPKSVDKPVLIFLKKLTYEEISCVGYNPETKNLEATILVKKSFGYSGPLCQQGSFEYVRFYLDFHDGNGFIDQGVASNNVHDIPLGTDCSNLSTFPLNYVIRKGIVNENARFCNQPVLPTLRAILSWNQQPAANDPNW